MMSQYPCPQCQTNLIWNPNNAHWPFCSERCQQIDLGAWASGDYAIAGDELEMISLVPCWNLQISKIKSKLRAGFSRSCRLQNSIVEL